MEKEYKRLLQEIKDSYFLIQDEKVIIVNSNMAEILRCEGPDDLIGRHCTELFPLEGRIAALDRYHKRIAGQIEPKMRYETILRRKDGTSLPVEVLVWLTLYRGKPAIAGIIVDLTERRQKDVERMRIKENEQKRLALTLHDSTIQGLLLVIHRLKDVADGSYGQVDLPAGEYLLEAVGLLENTVSEIRGIILDIRPDVLDNMGLIPSLRWLLDKNINENSTHSNVRVTGELRRLTTDTELALFRIAQEAINNIRKHAEASEVIIEVNFESHKVSISIQDNGKGFEFQQTMHQFVQNGKLGLDGMSDRVHLLNNGQFTIQSVLGKGTTIKVTVED